MGRQTLRGWSMCKIGSGRQAPRERTRDLRQGIRFKVPDIGYWILDFELAIWDHIENQGHVKENLRRYHQMVTIFVA